MNHEIEDSEINEDNLSKFYGTYKQVMNRVGGTPYPFAFFENLMILLKDSLKLFTIEVEGEYGGGYLHFLDKKNRSVLHFFGAIKEEYFKYYPNELLHAFSIKWGLEKNFKHYDFGATSAFFNDSLFTFKQEFGGEVIPNLSWEKGYSKYRWRLFEMWRGFYKRVKG